MATWSLCMIVKNEENILKRVLSSVNNIFDEIIIVDTGSIDKTKDIAKSYNAKIYDFEWNNDFSAARNYAFSKATKDYIMWLDADDVVRKKDFTKMKKLKKTMNKDINIHMFKYNISFDENNNPSFSYYRERLIKNNINNKWVDPVHEYIPLTGSIEYHDIGICHQKEDKNISFRNLSIYETMKKQGQEFTPRNKYYYARELYDHKKYALAIEEFDEFLGSKKGWVEDNINACVMIANCYLNLHHNEKALKYLLSTFEYDIPRRKTCSLIGNFYFHTKELDKAIFWYNQALLVPINTSGFYEVDYDEFIPCLNLCVCYFKKQEYKASKMYHDIAASLKPTNEIVMQNTKYFESIDNS